MFLFDPANRYHSAKGRGEEAPRAPAGRTSHPGLLSARAAIILKEIAARIEPIRSGRRFEARAGAEVMAEDTVQSNRQRVLIVIPAYNEAAKIPQVMADLREHAPSTDVVVVDDGSTDDTAAIAESEGATVLRLPFNLGIGGALQTGYQYAHENGYDIAVQFDGDGQHRGDQIARLIAPVAEGRADLVIGSRMIGKRQYRFPLVRRIGSRLIGLVTFLVTGRWVTDPTSGSRAISRRTIAFFARHYPQAYLESPEATVWVARQGMSICEVPVRMRTAAHSSVGNITGVFHSLRVCLALLVDRIESRFPECPRPASPPEETLP